jgi:hypothetical protein
VQVRLSGVSDDAVVGSLQPPAPLPNWMTKLVMSIGAYRQLVRRLAARTLARAKDPVGGDDNACRIALFLGDTGAGKRCRGERLLNECFIFSRRLLSAT